MMELINSFVNYATNLLQTGGIFYGFLLIILESVIPALPLGVFIALNINAYGFFIGFLISWIATSTGCFMSYLLFKYLGEKLFKRLSHKHKKQVTKLMKSIHNISFSNLVIIIALPFSPAFLINIAAGLANISKKKFITAILIGKISIVYFWGYIGKSFIESMTDIRTIIIIAIMLLLAFLISKFIGKKMNLE